MERLERETEIHRTQKALRSLLDELTREADIAFPESRVLVVISPETLRSRGGQFVVAMLVNLLIRMKTIIQAVSLAVPDNIALHRQVPLQGQDLRSGLAALAESVSGPLSPYAVVLDLDGRMTEPTISLAIGHDAACAVDAPLWIEADGWTAFVNVPVSCADWDTALPFGSHLAASLGVAELFKWLLLHNFPDQAAKRAIKFLENTAFSALTYASSALVPSRKIGLEPIQLDNLAVVGVGAGGSAAVYSLACLPALTGSLHLIDPGRHKPSSLARYLLSSYGDCYDGSLKADVASSFLKRLQPGLRVQTEIQEYAALTNRRFPTVVSTVDTPEARWDIQRDSPPLILDAAVVETIYAVLRVSADTAGMCLGCKHPYDPDVTWKRRARMWGKTIEQVRRLYFDQTPVGDVDLAQLAYVQGQPVERYSELLGRPFDQIPALTECGDTHFDLKVPNQAATLPFVTTIAGVLIAAEVVKDQLAPEHVLSNWFDHDLLWTPKPDRLKFRARNPSCRFCGVEIN